MIFFLYNTAHSKGVLYQKTGLKLIPNLERYYKNIQI